MLSNVHLVIPGAPESGDIAPCLFKKGATGQEVPLHNSVIGNLTVYQDWLETNSLQLFAHPENSEWFIIFEVCIVAEQEQA